MRKTISASALKTVCVLYEGDIYDLACLLNKISKAKSKGTNTITLHTVHGLATSYSYISRLPHEKIKAVLESYGLPLGAIVKHED